LINEVCFVCTLFTQNQNITSDFVVCKLVQHAMNIYQTAKKYLKGRR